MLFLDGIHPSSIEYATLLPFFFGGTCRHFNTSTKKGIMNPNIYKHVNKDKKIDADQQTFSTKRQP
jgi:hypothetical protein